MPTAESWNESDADIWTNASSQFKSKKKRKRFLFFFWSIGLSIIVLTIGLLKYSLYTTSPKVIESYIGDKGGKIKKTLANL